MTATGPREGLSVTHRRYVPASHAHYGGNLVDGAYVLGLFGDVATELAIRTDGDESLFASYSEVQFLAPVLAGDVVEATAVLARVGRRSRELAFEAGSSAALSPSVGSRPRGCSTSPSSLSPRPARSSFRLGTDARAAG